MEQAGPSLFVPYSGVKRYFEGMALRICREGISPENGQIFVFAFWGSFGVALICFQTNALDSRDWEKEMGSVWTESRETP